MKTNRSLFKDEGPAGAEGTGAFFVQNNQHVVDLASPQQLFDSRVPENLSKTFNLAVFTYQPSMVTWTKISVGCSSLVKNYTFNWGRDQREWVFEVREVKIKSFHSFSRSAK